MKIKIACTDVLLEMARIEEIEAQALRIKVGKKVILVAVHESVAGASRWVVTVPEVGARLAWGETRKEAIQAAQKKVQAIGYVRYWATVRDHQKNVLAGNDIRKAGGVSVRGYKDLSKTCRAKENIRLLEAAGARQ